MTKCVFAIPGDLATTSGGYAYARKILPLLADRMEIDICALPGEFPFPSEAGLSEAARALAAAEGRVLLIDGLAFGALPVHIIASLKSPIVALVHHPLGLEEGLSLADKSHFLLTEGEALASARHIVVTSPATARALSSLFGIRAEKITIAEPGIMSGPRAKGAGAGAPLHIVSVGTLTPRKGFGVLVDALHEVREMHWRATIAGPLDRAPETAAAVVEKIAAYGLGDRIRLTGALDEAAVSALYRSGDIFALASFYEGYGMAFAEAMAHGLPVVASGGGAVADTVPPDAGFVCPTGDVAGIAEALRALLSNSDLRQAKAAAAYKHGQTLPGWVETANIIAGVLEREAA